MTILGLIPARSGSQRLPKKNLADLGGLTLLEWSINAARDAKLFDHIVVSTDDPEITNLAKHRACEAIDRPKELARNETEMLPVVKHARVLFPADVIILLQPTSPFRTAEDINLAYEQLRSFKADSVVSVTPAPRALAFEIGHANRIREAKNVVVPNGALYLITQEHLDTGGDWYNGLVYSYLMPKERSLDIDTQYDLDIARMVVAKRAA